MRNFIKKFFFFFFLPLFCIPIIRIPFRRQGYKLPSLAEKWKVDALPCSYDPRTEKKFHTYVYISRVRIFEYRVSRCPPPPITSSLPSRISYSCESRRLFRDDGRKVARKNSDINHRLQNPSKTVNDARIFAWSTNANLQSFLSSFFFSLFKAKASLIQYSILSTDYA